MYLVELRIWWMMHRCKRLWGYTASMAWSIPQSPFVQNRYTSYTPRLLRLFNTFSQNLLLSCAPIQTPRMPFRPSMVIPRTT